MVYSVKRASFEQFLCALVKAAGADDEDAFYTFAIFVPPPSAWLPSRSPHPSSVLPVRSLAFALFSCPDLALSFPPFLPLSSSRDSKILSLASYDFQILYDVTLRPVTAIN